MSSSSCPRVVVVGAAASGMLTAIHLTRLAGRRRHAEIHLVDPADRTGRGVAFGTTDDRHVLNVVAGNMSALPEDPGHFVAWRTRQHPEASTAPLDFAPRREYGRYLQETLDEALARGARRAAPAPSRPGDRDRPHPLRRAGARHRRPAARRGGGGDRDRARRPEHRLGPRAAGRVAVLRT